MASFFLPVPLVSSPLPFELTDEEQPRDGAGDDAVSFDGKALWRWFVPMGLERTNQHRFGARELSSRLKPAREHHLHPGLLEEQGVGRAGPGGRELLRLDVTLLEQVAKVLAQVR